MEYCSNFFGNQYGWAPYYAYPPTYIVRPNNWYAPKWNAWYQRNPHYWQNFEQKYPYWRGHRVGQRYDQNFYNKYHRGQGEGWNQGFHGVRPPAQPRSCLSETCSPRSRLPETWSPWSRRPSGKPVVRPVAHCRVRPVSPLVLVYQKPAGIRVQATGNLEPLVRASPLDRL